MVVLPAEVVLVELSTGEVLEAETEEPEMSGIIRGPCKRRGLLFCRSVNDPVAYKVKICYNKR